jgi:outer membrane lipoprotein carrier protein
MRIHRACVAALFVSCVPGVSAQTADEMLERMREAYEDLRDVELRFSQRVWLPLAGIEQEARGTLTFKKDNRYRVETGDRTIVTDGKTVWSYSTATRQVLIDTFRLDEGALTPERVLLGPPGGYTATVLGKERLDGAAVVLLKLVPRDESATLTAARLWVHTGDWIVRKAEVEDGGGRLTTYRVERLRVNKGIPDSRFTFQVPDGVEAVDLR